MTGHESAIGRGVRRSSVLLALNRARLKRAAAARGGDVIWAAPPLDGSKLIALTFDDGPAPANTPILLDQLRRHDAHATFFVVGRGVQEHPGLARRIVAEGHELGNHTHTHVSPLEASDAEMRDEFDNASRAICEVALPPAVMRPPYGKRPAELAGIAAACGMRTILWSIDSRDTAELGPAAVAGEVVTRARPGDIVLMHDGAGRREPTLRAVPIILEALSARGFRFVTVSELLGAAGHYPKG
jgi:peptidoglycan/xylan/chitin deacetylase (PgdA/CDA1 family)